jgi:uncharacterized protein (UPF0147 family)
MNTLYTAETAERILGELAAGRSLHDICRDDGMPHQDTVLNWVRQDREGFAARYRQARQSGHGSPGNVGYSPEIAHRFLGEVMGGRTLVEVCDDPDMPHHATINRWVVTDHEGFAARYRSARQVGRLSRAKVAYTREIADQVLDELMSGRTLVDICADPEMPSATAVRQWLRDNLDGFTARYWEAREIGYQMIGDQALRIVDDRRNDWIIWHREDGTAARMLDPQRVSRALARVSTRRWLLSKMLPKTFGERPDFYARQGAGSDDMAEFMKLLNGRSRGLPSEDEPLDEE